MNSILKELYNKAKTELPKEMRVNNLFFSLTFWLMYFLDRFFGLFPNMETLAVATTFTAVALVWFAIELAVKARRKN